MEWIDTSKLHQFRYVANPYLRHLEAQGVLCPKCAAKLYIEPASYSPDFGLWICPRRGVVDGVQAPEFASMPMDEAILRTRQWQKTRMQKSRQQSGMLQNGRQLAHGDASSLSRDSELIHVSACRKDARGPEGSFLSGATIWMEQQIEEATCR